MRQVRSGGLVALAALALAAAGCDVRGKCGDGSSDNPTRCGSGSDGGSSDPGKPGEPNKPGPDGKTTSFESDLTRGSADGLSNGGRGTADSAESGAAAPTAPGAATGGVATPNGANPQDAKGGEADRAIAEADIIQQQGNRLYALSRIAGLAVIDVTDPAALKLLGRYRELPATPFEMYLQDGVALVMFTGWGQYAEAQDGTVSWVQTSKLLALDVADPANIANVGSFDIPGGISDSRMVGDILYVVGYEDGYCWRCEREKPRTSISSLNVADPRNVQKIDELFYDNSNPSWGQRSVSVTNQRMYVAGPEYGQERPTGSTIQVIDISDAAGDLVEGTSVRVEGQIDSRWQMDEYQGVLRVVSQPPRWWDGQGVVNAKPAIETFKVESSSKLSELGRSDIVLPPNDTLRSVRFDGERGYAITAEQVDPLFTLDLSDPANPRTVGELKIPGWVYHMEPRGDRLLGLGYDQGNAAGGLTVSLFDVSDMAKPTELSRVNFGGTWGHYPEDQNRIHKVFKVLDDAGVILVPFSGWSEGTAVQEDCYISEYVGGVQLIDFANDTLNRRGAAASQGETRRALLLKDKLLSVGDERVQSFDVANRDKPALISEVVLSRNVNRAVQLESGTVVRIAQDYTKGGWEADFVGSDDAADPNKSLAHVSLTELAGSSSDRCKGNSLNVEDTFVRGNTLEVLYMNWGYDQSKNQQQNTRGLLVIDASDASAPKLVANVTWDNGEWQPYSSYYSYGYYGSTNSYVRTDTGLVLLESKWEYTPTTSTQKTRLRVVDLRNLDDAKATNFPFEAKWSFSGLHADGDIVMTSHLEPTSQDGRRGKFYIDRFDVSDPAAPSQLQKINVPGALMSFDGDNDRALTSEQVRVIVDGKISSDECYKRFANAEWIYPSDQNGNVASAGVATSPSASGGAPVDQPPPVLGECTGFKQRLNLVHLVGDVAELDDRLELSEDKQLFSFSKGDGVVFATAGRGGYYGRGGWATPDIACFGPCGGGQLSPAELIVLGGFANGELEIGYITVEDKGANQWYGFWGTPPVYAYGKRAMLIGQSDLAIIDGSNVTTPELVKRVPLIGSVSYAEIHEDNALLSFGQQGVQWVGIGD
jgi:hypothetical protein